MATMECRDADQIAAWDQRAAEDLSRARVHWASQPIWGVWRIPEQQLSLLADVQGLQAIELGCGSAYISAWLARRGACPVAVDYSTAQLRLAERMQQESGLSFPLQHADVRCLPFADRSFDLAISEYGACTWCDPAEWLPEASRVLRPGGRLIFLVNSPLMMLCLGADGEALHRQLQRSHCEHHRLAWQGSALVEHHCSSGGWIRQLRAHGFAVEDLRELMPPAGAADSRPEIAADWAERWPVEHLWLARKTGGDEA
jgi:SAM-dependent methyltransferase